MVIGGPGSGKTWLARELGTLSDLPVTAIDDFVHDAARNLRAPDLIDADCRAAADGPRWIIEGGNSRTYDYRAARADCLILLTPPRWLRLWRVWRRDGWNGVLQQWTWRYEAVFGPRDRALMASVVGGVPTVELRSRQAVASFIATFAHPARPLRP